MIHDLTESLRLKITKCSHCKGSGYRLDKHGEMIQCVCLAEAVYELKLARSGIPPRFKHLEFKDYMYKNSHTFSKIWRYIEQADKAAQTGTGLFLYGPTQTGKSLLAICVLKELMRKGYECGFLTFEGLLSETNGKNTHLGKEKTFACVDNVTEVLDNLVNFKETNLTHQMTNGAVSFLDSVVSGRAVRNQPSILTSRVSIEEIAKRFPSLGTTLWGSFLEVECVQGDFRGSRIQERLNKEFGFDEIS